MNVAACSSCGKPIIWTTSPTGARLPLTAKPVTVYQIDEEHSRAMNTTPDANKLEGGPFYISHFVDCPNANQHSRGARS